MTSLKSTDRITRIVLVTAGLSVSGGVVGALCATAAVTAIAAIEGGSSGLVSRVFANILGVSAGFGAVAGMVGAPLIGWGLLRRVPLGRAMAFTAGGTVAGALAGELMHPLKYASDIPAVLIGAFVGFLLGAIVVRLRPGTTATVPIEPDSVR